MAIVKVIPIQSLDHPDLAPYRTMKRPIDQQRQGIFVAEGEKVVRRLLETDFAVLSVVLPPKWVAEFSELIERRDDGNGPAVLPVYVAEKPVLEQLTGFSMYQGLMAVAQIPRPATLDQLLATNQKPHLFAAVDGLASAENLGVVVRNAVGFGVQGLFVGETSSSPYLRRAVRSSMGTVFRLPVIEVDDLASFLGTLRQRGIRLIAAHPHTDKRTLANADFRENSCIVFGSEGLGISPSVLAVCDEIVVIPMASGVDSLNVGSAAAVFLYEANRQRSRM